VLAGRRKTVVNAPGGANQNAASATWRRRPLRTRGEELPVAARGDTGEQQGRRRRSRAARDEGRQRKNSDEMGEASVRVWRRRCRCHFWSLPCFAFLRMVEAWTDKVLVSSWAAAGRCTWRRRAAAASWRLESLDGRWGPPQNRGLNRYPCWSWVTILSLHILKLGLQKRF
jgi:hypothetical protein